MINIGVLGLGTVGSGIVKIINTRKDILKQNTGHEINIKKILVKDLEKIRKVEVEKQILTDDSEDILNDEDISIVVEVTGDIEKSYSYIKDCLNKGKHVVTANKGVVSKYFEELSTLAEKNHVAFLYESSVGGGIPILKNVKRQVILNNIKVVKGILNGTCNYILDEMTNNGISYDKALQKAQGLGYAELDPSSDVSGLDTMRKLRILSSLTMGGKVGEEDIILRGIENITPLDIREFKDKDMIVKLIGKVKAELDGFMAIVGPMLIKEGSNFSNVDGAYNMISISGEDIETLDFKGPGAGEFPTANAVVSDILDIILKEYSSNSPLGNKILVNRNGNIDGKYYLRINKDQLTEDMGEKLKSISNTYEEKEEVVIFTKKVFLSYIYELLTTVDNNKYFLARIEE